MIRESHHPSLLSSIVKKLLFEESVGIDNSGNLFTLYFSTLKPTPVPDILKYIISAKSLNDSGAEKEQLYTQTLHLSAAEPANCNKRILGITSMLSKDSLIL